MTITDFHQAFPRVRLRDLAVTDLRLPIHVKPTNLHSSPSPNQQLHSMTQAQHAHSGATQESTTPPTGSVTDNASASKRKYASWSEWKKHRLESV
jgi:hypothetical protein